MQRCMAEGPAISGTASADATFNQGIILWNTGKIAEAKGFNDLVIATGSVNRRPPLTRARLSPLRLTVFNASY